MMKSFTLLRSLFTSISMAATTDFWRLRYDKNGQPLVDVEIAGRYHTLAIDTGNGEGLHLYKFAADKLIATPDILVTRQPSRQTIDVAGNINSVPAWQIQRLFISGIPFENIAMVYLKPWGLVIGGRQPVNETLRRGIFDNRRTLLDFKKDRMQILDQLPADVDNWSSYPLAKTKSGLRIKAYTGNVPLHLIIDTGATHSMLFSENLPANTLFSGCKSIEPKANNLDCRVTRIVLKNNNGNRRNEFAIIINGSTPEKIDFDGLVGMTFLRHHQVIIDMVENKLYIRR